MAAAMTASGSSSRPALEKGFRRLRKERFAGAAVVSSTPAGLSAGGAEGAADLGRGSGAGALAMTGRGLGISEGLAW